MGGQLIMYTQIVVGTDGSQGASIAVGAAVELAKLTGATVHVVHAYKVISAASLSAGAEVGMLPAVGVLDSNDLAEERGRLVCDDVVERAREAGVTAVAHSVPGDAADALVSVANEVGADLVVVGNRGMSGVKRFVLGSVPNKVSHHCPTSLLVVDTSQVRD
jgi:nucleotide-binding universal stress UspA family protein